MTDNEIINGLRCMKSVKYKYCYGCPLCKQFPNCKEIITEEAISLLNRLKTEIQVQKENNNCLKHELAMRDSLINIQKINIENLKEQICYLEIKNPNKAMFHFHADLDIEAFKADIINKFIEQHKEIMREFLDDNNDFVMKWCEYEVNTNNLVKEIIGSDINDK